MSAVEELAELQEYIQEYSLAMPGEDHFSHNVDGAEESEILAFIEQATVTYEVIHAAQEAVGFDEDAVAGLRFRLDEHGLLVAVTAGGAV